jgi:hypothetical protein
MEEKSRMMEQQILRNLQIRRRLGALTNLQKIRTDYLRLQNSKYQVMKFRAKTLKHKRVSSLLKC